jgi:hypothetical protein
MSVLAASVARDAGQGAGVYAPARAVPTTRRSTAMPEPALGSAGRFARAEAAFGARGDEW